MNRSVLNAVLRQAGGLSAPARESDADLLGRFAAGRDGEAFAELVRRHGPMVWAVCRHLLPLHADAEDAFQATFLALVRSAGAVRKPHALGGWLHGVAVKAATKLKRAAVRRKQREAKAAGPEAGRPVPEGTWESLLAAVHEEVRRLPDALRAAFVLCDLEGVGQPDAAARLGWKPGTLTGRLCKARQVLVERLSSRGLAPLAAGGVTGLGVATAGGSVPAALYDKVMSHVTADGAVPAALLQLVREVTPMVLTRAKLLAAAVLVAGGLTAGVGFGLIPGATAQPPYGGGGPGGPGGGADTPIFSGAIPDDPIEADGGGGGGADDEPAPPKRPRTAPPAGSAKGGGGTPPAAGRGSGGPPRGPATEAPGAPGLPPGGMPGMPGGPPIATGEGGPPARGGPAAWEYKFETLKSWDRGSFEKLLTRLGNDGWEYAGAEQFDRGGAGERVVVFKKRKGGNVIAGGMIGPGGFGGGMMAPGGSPFGGGGGFPGGGGSSFGGPPQPTPGPGAGGPRGGGAEGGSSGGPGRPARGTPGVGGPTPGGGGPGGDSGFNPGGGSGFTPAPTGGRPGGLSGAGGSGDTGGPGSLIGGLSGAGGRMAGMMGGGMSGPPLMSSEGMMGGMGMGGPGGGPPRPANRPVVLKLRNAAAPDIRETLAGVFTNVQITVDSRTNSLIIRADQETLREVQELLRELDTPSDAVPPTTPKPLPGAGGRPGGRVVGAPPGYGPAAPGLGAAPPPGVGAPVGSVGGGGDALPPPGGLGDPRVIPSPGGGDTSSPPAFPGGPSAPDGIPGGSGDAPTPVPDPLPPGGPAGGGPGPIPEPAFPPAGGEPGGPA